MISSTNNRPHAENSLKNELTRVHHYFDRSFLYGILFASFILFMYSHNCFLTIKIDTRVYLINFGQNA